MVVSTSGLISQHRHVFGDERGIEFGHQRSALFGLVPGEPEGVRRGAAVVRHDSGRRIDGKVDDLFRSVVRDIFDVDAALGGDDERHAPDGAIDQQRQIKFLVDRRPFFDVEPVDLLAGGPGLDGDQRRAEHLRGVGFHLGHRLRKPDAAFFAGGSLFELALAAPAGMDL